MSESWPQRGAVDGALLHPLIAGALSTARANLASGATLDQMREEVAEHLRMELDELVSRTRRFDLLHRRARAHVAAAVSQQLDRRYGMSRALRADELVSPVEDAGLIALGYSPRQHMRAHPRTPLDRLSDQELIVYRDRVRWEEGFISGGCHEVAPGLTHHYAGSVAESGYFLWGFGDLPQGGRGGAIHHYWNRLSDGSIIDATYDQFALGAPIGRFGPTHPMQERYVAQAPGCVSGWICEDALTRDPVNGQFSPGRCPSCKAPPDHAIATAVGRAMNRGERAAAGG